MSGPKETVMRNPFFTYRARLDRVIDGDTIDIHLDLGFRMRHSARVRLAGVDTHEVYGVDHESEEYQRGKTESLFVAEWFRITHESHDAEDDWPLLVSTMNDETGKYGRYIAEIYRRDTGESLSDALKSEFDDIAY